MQLKLEQFKQELLALENMLFSKTRQLHMRLSELTESCDKGKSQVSVLKEEKEVLSKQLKQLQHQYATLQYAHSTANEHAPQAIKPHEQQPEHMDAVHQTTVVESLPRHQSQSTIDTLAVKEWQLSTLHVQPYIAMLLHWLAPLYQLFARISVLAHVYEYGLGIFNHYKGQGKTAVFLLTVSGMILLVTGFAYMLQYSFVKLSLEWKLACGFMVAAAVVILGARMHIAKRDMQDYAAALIGLGLVLAYLCAYFMGTAFVSEHSLLAFVVLALLTFLAYGLALAFSTRVVALVSLVGGACLPLLGHGQDWLMLAYPGYLLLLNISSLHLANKIRWTGLSYIAFVLSATMLEYQFSQGLQAILLIDFLWLVFVFHAFFYLYLLYSYRLLNTNAKAKGVMLMTANMLLFLALMSQLLEPSMLGGCFIANAFLLGAFFTQQYFKQDRQRCRMLVLQAGVFLALAIFNWVDAALMSVLWGIEAMLLLYMSLAFQIRSVRYQAYVVLFLAFFQAVWQCQMLIGVSSWMVEGVWINWLLLMSIGVFMQCTLILLCAYKEQLQGTELYLKYILRETLSGWLLVTALLSVYLFSTEMYLLIVLPLMLLLLERSARLNLHLTEISAWLLFTLPLFQILASANVAGSFMFSAMDWVGQLAYLEVFSLLWLVSAFYIRRYPHSKWITWAIPMQTLFYLIVPVCFLSEVFTMAYFWLPTVLWGSALLSFVLYRWKKHDALYLEQMFLSVVAIAFSLNAAIWGAGFSTLHISLALFAGLGYFAIIMMYFKGWSLRERKHRYQPLFIATFYYAGTCCFLLSMQAFNEILAALLVLQLFLVWVVWVLPSFQPLRTQLGYWYLLALGIPLIMLDTIVMQLEFGLVVLLLWPAVLMSLLLVHVKRRHFESLWTFKGSYNNKLVYSHICLFTVYSVTLLIWSLEAFQAAWSILIVLHATLMLYESLWPRFAVLLRTSIALFIFAGIKIIFYDLNDLAMLEKVVAFMLMGSALLLAAYWFQRLKTRLQQRVTV